MRKLLIVLDLFIIFNIKNHDIKFEFFKNIKIYLKNSKKIEMYQNICLEKRFL